MASVIAALILLSPVVAFLMVIAAEVLIDALMEAGMIGVSAVAIGAVGWVQFRSIWRAEIAQGWWAGAHKLRRLNDALSQMRPDKFLRRPCQDNRMARE